MNLPPLNFDEEVEKYEAFEEKKELNFPVCSHEQTTITNGWLRCKCGNSWQGPVSVLVELQKTFRNKLQP